MELFITMSVLLLNLIKIKESKMKGITKNDLNCIF